MHDAQRTSEMIDTRPRHEVLYGRGHVTFEAYLQLNALASLADGADRIELYTVAYHAACIHVETHLHSERELQLAARALDVEIGPIKPFGASA